MADSTSNNIQTTVLQVEVGGAIKSTKEYKEYLDGLKASLLGLEKGTEQYNKVAGELRTGQEKLNEVMDIARGKGDAVEGSYDNLSQTMTKLKKEWKATGDVAKRAELATQINDINNQLKDMDASVGVFSRNVGNYAGAFEDAFKNVLGEIGQVDGGLGDLAKTTNQLIPLIKKTNQVALAGLSGIKKAIAATGIGLLIVAVGTLVSNFDALRKAVGITDEQFQTFKTKATGVLEKVGAGVTGVGNVILQFLIRPIKETIALVKGLAQIFGRVLQPIKAFIQALVDRQGIKGAFTALKDAATGMFTDIGKTLEKTGGEIKDIYLQSFDIKGNFQKGQEVGENFIKGMKDGAEKEGPVTVKTKVDDNESELKAIKERLSWFGLTDEETIKKQFEERRKALKKQFEAEKDLLKKAGEDTSKLQQEYYLNLASTYKEEADAYELLQDSKVAMAEAAQEKQEVVINNEIEDLQRFQEELDKTQDAINKALQDEIAATERLKQQQTQAVVDTMYNIADILDIVSDAWKDNVEAQIEAGEISEEEGKKQFQKIKDLQTAQTIINTAAGVVAALTSPSIQSLGPIGWVAAATQAAAILTAGYVQIKKIQSTNIGSKGANNTSIPKVESIADYMPSYTQTVTNQTDIDALSNALATNMKSVNLSVSVSEIDTVQNRVKTREVESSF